MDKTDNDTSADASAIWRVMLDILLRTSPDRVKSLQKRHLTPNDSRVLFALDNEGKPIAKLAHDLDCHPSTATWLVDRLVRLGYAGRHASQMDKRIKLVTLTHQGADTKTALLSEYGRPPSAFDTLTRDELAALEVAIRKLHANLSAPASKQASAMPTGPIE